MKPRAALVRSGALALLVGMAAATRLAAQRVTEAGGSRQVGALPAIPFLEASALGYREAAADFAWLQAVQYYGEHRQGGNDLAEFSHYVAAVNALDPRFEHPYIFGAFVLATERQDLPAALELLRRGARAHANSPNCLFEMGFLNYVGGGDPEASLRYLALSAQRPGGRDRAVRFMAFLNRKLGRLETAWLLWNEIYRETRDPNMRSIAAESMRRLESQMGRRP